MRTISMEKDYGQLVVIFFFVVLYFQIAEKAKQELLPSVLSPIGFLCTFTLTVVFFWSAAQVMKQAFHVKNFIFTLGYSLLPTLMWFTSNSLLFYFLPPPRTFSLLGKAFSIVFVSYSVSLLLWKIILFYLAIRFSSRMNFFAIVYMIILYLAVFIPYSLLLFHLRLFRIPFI